MQHGVAAEHGAPAELLNDDTSLFSALVRDTGKQSEQSLRASAYTTWERKTRGKACLGFDPNNTAAVSGVPRVTASEGV